MLALRPLRISSRRLTSSAVRSADSGESSSSYLRRQAALEDIEDALPRTPREPAAAKEDQSVFEKATRKSTPKIADSSPAPWEGAETQRKLVERVMQDSYKPLRVKGFVKKIPAPAPLPNCLFHNQPEASSSKSDPPPPAQPFEYKFKAPDSYNPNPTNYNLGPSIKPTPKRARLTSARAMKAREESLDYGFESGFGGSMNRVFVPDEDSDQREASDEGKRTGMGGMRAWNGIIDDKIDKARRSGAFDRLKGRGKPYQRNDEDDNPHISREDFLMNRIVKSQGAAPPWIELQRDLDMALETFRSELRQAWFRRATRMRSLDVITRSTLTEVREGWRDPDWEAREQAYHKVALASLNALLRRFNIQAPYTVRRPLLLLENELKSCVVDSAGAVERELKRRMDGGIDPSASRPIKEVKAVEESMWMAFRRAMNEVVGIAR